MPQDSLLYNLWPVLNTAFPFFFLHYKENREIYGIKASRNLVLNLYIFEFITGKGPGEYKIPLLHSPSLLSLFLSEPLPFPGT